MTTSGGGIHETENLRSVKAVSRDNDFLVLRAENGAIGWYTMHVMTHRASGVA